MRLKENVTTIRYYRGAVVQGEGKTLAVPEPVAKCLDELRLGYTLSVENMKILQEYPELFELGILCGEGESL